MSCTLFPAGMAIFSETYAADWKMYCFYVPSKVVQNSSSGLVISNVTHLACGAACSDE